MMAVTEDPLMPNTIATQAQFESPLSLELTTEEVLEGSQMRDLLGADTDFNLHSYLFVDDTPTNDMDCSSDSNCSSNIDVAQASESLQLKPSDDLHTLPQASDQARTKIPDTSPPQTRAQAQTPQLRRSPRRIQTRSSTRRLLGLDPEFVPPPLPTARLPEDPVSFTLGQMQMDTGHEKEVELNLDWETLCYSTMEESGVEVEMGVETSMPMKNTTKMLTTTGTGKEVEMPMKMGTGMLPTMQMTPVLRLEKRKARVASQTRSYKKRRHNYNPKRPGFPKHPLQNTISYKLTPEVVKQVLAHDKMLRARRYNRLTIMEEEMGTDESEMGSEKELEMGTGASCFKMRHFQDAWPDYVLSTRIVERLRSSKLPLAHRQAVLNAIRGGFMDKHWPKELDYLEDVIFASQPVTNDDPTGNHPQAGGNSFSMPESKAISSKPDSKRHGDEPGTSQIAHFSSSVNRRLFSQDSRNAVSAKSGCTAKGTVHQNHRGMNGMMEHSADPVWGPEGEMSGIHGVENHWMGSGSGGQEMTLQHQDYGCASAPVREDYSGARPFTEPSPHETTTRPFEESPTRMLLAKELKSTDEDVYVVYGSGSKTTALAGMKDGNKRGVEEEEPGPQRRLVRVLGCREPKDPGQRKNAATKAREPRAQRRADARRLVWQLLTEKKGGRYVHWENLRPGEPSPILTELGDVWASFYHDFVRWE